MMPPHKQHRHIRRQRWYLSIINIFLATIPTLFTITAYAIPTFTVVAAADIPRGTNAAAPTTPTQIPTTTYTVTKISSTTLTTVSSVPVLHISPHVLSLITTVTVTTYEPWPAFPSGPSSGNLAWSSTTVLEEVVSSVTWVERRRYLERRGTAGLKGGGGEEEEEGYGDKKQENLKGGKEEETTITSFVVTTENTWVVHPAPGPTTDIFLATGVGVVVGCGGCSLAPAQPTGSGSRMGRAETKEPARRWEQSTAQEQQENVTRDKPKGQLGTDMTWTESEAEEATGVPVVEGEGEGEGEGEDPICKSSNLTTACQGQQCIWKPRPAFFFTTTNNNNNNHHHQAINSTTFPDTSSTTHPEAPHPATGAATATATATAKVTGTGTYWCLHIHPYHYADPSLRMGRACWGPYLRYRQLNAPCLVGDVGMACLPCVKGGEGEPGRKDESWDAVFWEGEE